MTPVRVDPTRSDPTLYGDGNAVRDDELHAYVDGQLDSRRRAAVEAYLAAHPDEAARISAYRSQNIGLHALFDPLGGPGDPAASGGAALPPALAALAQEFDATLAARHSGTSPSQRPGPRRAIRSLPGLAASVALLASAGAAGWIALEQNGWRHDPLVAFTRQATQMAPATQAPATQAPAQSLPAATPVGTGSSTGERQVAAWLAAQTGNGAASGDAPATLPDLADLGFQLVGERVITTAGGPPAAQLLYQDDAGQRVTLTMRSGGKAGQTSFTFARDGDASRFMWQDAHMAYSLIGRLEQDKLLRLAEAVSASLHRGAPPAQETAVPPEDPAAVTQAPERTAPQAPLEGAPAAPSPSVDPAIERTPLIPVPLPEADATAKDT